MKLETLNLHHLLYFWTVAYEGTVTAASARLHLTQPTISMQIRKLERAVGHKLFRRVGRTLVLTEVGQLVYRYADEMFALGRELSHALGGAVAGRPTRLTVGVPDAMPKIVTYRLLQPVLTMADQVQLVCHEAKLDQLLADLSVHRYDVVLSDAPLGLGARIKAFHHTLGDCGVAFCGTRDMVRRHRRRFPDCLTEAPLLLPTANNELRRALDQWFDAHGGRPQIAGEFEDSALLKEFGKGGWGLFPVPAAVLPEVVEQYGVATVGTLEAVRTRFYAITTQRRIRHPAVAAICASSRTDFLS